MTGLALREGISFCETGGRLLFLDLPNDRYFCLAEGAERSFRRLAGGESLSGTDEAALSGLEARGILSRGGHVVPAGCPAPPVPVRSLADEQLQPGAAALGKALLRLAAGTIRLRMGSLQASLECLRRRKAKSLLSRRPDEAAERVAAAFKRTALLLPSLDRCLPRSIAAAHSLLDEGVEATLVVGVRLNPFGAHCWVQSGDLLVNESLDQVRNFTPILVV